MKRYSGKTVCKGIALGRIRVLNNSDCHVKRTKITDTEAEIQRLKKSHETAKEQLDALYQKAVSEVGEASAAIFEVHKMLLEGKLPYTIGGGIGQSRLSMLLLGKAHIGEVQSSVWDAKTKEECAAAGIKLL